MPNEPLSAEAELARDEAFRALTRAKDIVARSRVLLWSSNLKACRPDEDTGLPEEADGELPTPVLPGQPT